MSAASVLGALTASMVAVGCSLWGRGDGKVTWADSRWVQSLRVSDGAPLTDAVESKKAGLAYATVRWRPDPMDASGIWCEYFEVRSGWPLLCCWYKEWMDHGPGPAVSVNGTKSTGIPVPRWPFCESPPHVASRAWTCRSYGRASLANDPALVGALEIRNAAIACVHFALAPSLLERPELRA